MGLTTYAVYGNIGTLYEILQSSGFFTSVTSSISDGTRTITCSDAHGERFIVKITGVDENGEPTSNTSKCGYDYYTVSGTRLTCCSTPTGTTRTKASWFPYIIRKTTSSMVFNTCDWTGTTPQVGAFVITKDNNGEIAVATSEDSSGGVNTYATRWNSGWFATKGSNAGTTGLGASVIKSATTLVPYASDDVSKVAYSPKVFRAPCSQVSTGQVGLATLNNSEYLCLYGCVFVKID